MSEYKVIAKEVTSIVWRDVQKAAQELASDVNASLGEYGLVTTTLLELQSP